MLHLIQTAVCNRGKERKKKDKVEKKCSNKALMRSRPCLTRRKLREWLPCFFTVPFETSRSSISCKVLCVLDASLRSCTCMHQKENWIQEPHLSGCTHGVFTVERSSVGVKFAIFNMGTRYNPNTKSASQG